MTGNSRARRCALALVPLAIATGITASAAWIGANADAAPGSGVAAARDDLGQLKGEEADALAQLTAVAGKLEAARANEETLSQRVTRQRALVADKKRELETLRANRRAVQEQLSERLAYWYRTGGVDVVQIVLGASSIEDALGQIDALRRITQDDEKIAEETRVAAAKAVTAEADLERVAGELEQARASAEQDASWLASVKAEKESLISRLRRDQQLTTARIGNLEAAAAAAAAERATPPPDTQQVIEPQTPPGDGTTSDPPATSEDPPATSDPPPDGPPTTGHTMVVEATAYTDRGTTADGTSTGDGVCATDTSVIPFGTSFYVPGYGTCTAHDTGGAIVGNIIDVWVPTELQAEAWGRRTVTITFE